MSKKGQFAIIVIVGLILLVGIVLFLIFSQKSVEIEIDSTQDISPGVSDPFHDFVEACLYNIAKEGLEKSGQHSGHVSTDGYFYNEITPSTEQEVIQFGDVLIPYWYYLRSSNDCRENCFLASEKPALSVGENSIKEQLQTYVNDNIDVCLNNFENFRNVYNEINILENPTSEVIFSDDEVFVKLNYPVSVVDIEKEQIFNDYQASLDVSFLRLYKFASGVQSFIADINFLEEVVTKNVLSAHSMGNDPSIPPMRGGTVPFSIGPWLVPQIKEDLKLYFNDEIGKVLVEGTLNGQIVFSDDVITNAQNMNFVLPMTGADYSFSDFSDFEVTFDYLPWWDIYLDITGDGASGNLITSPRFSLDVLGPIFSIYNANYIYDVSYPVLVRVSQPSAFNGLGYDFQFAIEENLRNNDPLDSSGVYSFLGLSDDNTFLCEIDQRNTGVIEINVIDFVSRDGVENAIVKYDCGTETCFIGETNSEGLLITNFPVCVNGELQISKLGYGSASLDFTTNVNFETSLEIELMPEINLEVKVEKKMAQKVVPTSTLLSNYYRSFLLEADWLFPTSTRVLEDGEEVVIMLNKVDEDYSKLISYNYTGVPASISLIPGIYEIEGYLSIPVGDGQALTRLNIRGGEIEDEVIEDMIIGVDDVEMFLLGGVDLKGSNVIEITLADLQLGNAIFYVSSLDVSDQNTCNDLETLNPDIYIETGTLNSYQCIYKFMDLVVTDKYVEWSENNPVAFTPDFVSSFS